MTHVLIPYFGDRRSGSITFEDVEQFQTEHATTPVGCNRSIEVLRSIYSWARVHRELRKIIRVDPCQGVEPFEEHPRHRALSDAELEREGRR